MSAIKSLSLKLFGSKEAKKKEVERLITVAVQAKRDGKLLEAKNLYHKALEFEPQNRITHYSLAKTCYLMKNSREAVKHYLTALHLDCLTWKFILSQPNHPQLNLFKSQYNIIQGTNPDLFKILTQTHPVALGLIIDPNTLRNLAHAAIDFHPKLRRTIPVDEHIKIYTMSIAGINVLLDENNEMQYYMPAGLGIALDNIRWDMLDNPDRLDFYEMEVDPTPYLKKFDSMGIGF